MGTNVQDKQKIPQMKLITTKKRECSSEEKLLFLYFRIFDLTGKDL